MQVKNFVPINFTSVEEVDKPERYLLQIKETLDDLGVKWGFAFGTALGLHRDDGFIPQDTDIDVMIIADDIDANTVAFAFLRNLLLIRTVVHDDKYHQIALQADDGFIVDLCFFYRNGNVYESYCEGGYWKDPVDTIGSFKDTSTKYGDFPVPEKIEDYLVDRYGDWQTPKYGIHACSIKDIA